MESSLATAPAKRLFRWGSVRVVTTGWRRLVTTRLARRCWGRARQQLQQRLLGLMFAVIDLYSRKLVAWEVHGAENGEPAAELIERARWRERLAGKPLILHADNGAAQRSQTLRAKLQDLGIEPSYSRPGVSDDNAYIESLFRTLEYVPAYPGAGFGDLEQARTWTQRFVDWYNGHHRHRGIGFVTPEQRHSGQSAAILARRREVYRAARQAHPGRWSRHIRRWTQPNHVALNKREEERKAA